MTTGQVVTTGARALLYSGLLGPPGPAAVLRLAREAYRGGTNLYTLLAIAAARWPDRPAIIDDDGALSYRELQTRTETLACELSLLPSAARHPRGLLSPTLLHSIPPV